MTTGENIPAIVSKIAVVSGVTVMEGDIDVSHRLPSKNRSANPPMIVRFVRRTIRYSFLIAAKKAKLRSGKLGFIENQPVYFNEDLTRINAAIFREPWKLRAGNLYQFVGVRNGTTYVKKMKVLAPGG